MSDLASANPAFKAELKTNSPAKEFEVIVTLAEMPTVSRHLSQLRNAGIVDDEKRGAQVFYHLVTPCVMNFFQCVASVRERSRG